MRSRPSTARSRRSRTSSAASSAAIRARSSSSSPAAGGRPEPTLSACAQVEQLVERAVADAVADLADEPADRRVGPVRLVAEHVVADEVDDALADGPRRAQPIEERAGQLRPDGVVADEVAVGERRRLADVVEQRGQPDDRARRRRGVDGPQRVIPQVLAGDLVLGDARAGRRAPARSPPSRPVSLSSRSPTDGARRASSLSSSAAIRSPDRWRDELGPRLGSRPASPARPRSRASPPGGRRGPSAARPPRTGPRGSPTARSTRRPTSARPSYGSTKAGCVRPVARPRPSR